MPFERKPGNGQGNSDDKEEAGSTPRMGPEIVPQKFKCPREDSAPENNQQDNRTPGVIDLTQSILGQGIVHGLRVGRVVDLVAKRGGY